jgi:hypothetical protein
VHFGRGSITLALVAVAGCSSVGTATSQGAVQTGGSSVALTFVTGLGETGLADLATVSHDRGTVDLITHDSSWSMFGSFYAGGIAVDVTAGHLGAKGMIAVLDTDGSVSLLFPNGMPHRLTFPIIAYRRVRNGQPVDSTPPARGMVLADLDGDGNDELIVGSDLGVAIVTDLAMYPTANPEKPPPGNGFRYDAGPVPGAVASFDFDGDGKRDVLCVDQSEATLRIYHNSGGPDQLAAPALVDLPAAGQAIAATGCPDAPAVVVLADGRMVRITKDGKAATTASELTPITRAAAGPAQVAVGSKAASGGVALYYACADSSELVQTPKADQIGVAMASGTDGHQELATLGADGTTVSVYELAGY